MLIGLHGQKQVGKDTIYEIIQKNFGHERKVVHKSFAKALKVSATNSFGQQRDPIEFCDALKTKGQISVDLGDESFDISGREFLQWFGTEGHRKVFGENFWVDICLPAEDIFHHEGQIWVVTDVRFENEAQRIKDLAGDIWHVIRPELENGDVHASEQPLDEEFIHQVVDNDSDLETLEAKICELVGAQIAVTRSLF